MHTSSSIHEARLIFLLQSLFLLKHTKSSRLKACCHYSFELFGSFLDYVVENFIEVGVADRALLCRCSSVAAKYGIDPDFYKKNDIHIHAPEGAVPKDGPSAGVTMTTALVSALSGTPVRADVAMTGEITLHGRVLPIGGLREKTMAAYKAEIGTVIIPVANKPDLEEVDDVVKNAIEFVYADDLATVLDTALIKQPVKRKRGRPAGRRSAAAPAN